MKRYRTFLCAIAAAAATFAGCDESLNTLTGPTPNLEVTFASIQQNIFEAPDLAGRVACVGCHTNVGRVPAAGLNLTHDVAYAQLVNVSSLERPSLRRVTPGDPDNSYLIHKVDGRSGIVGLRMPFSGVPFLTDGQILVLKRWIANGAPRD